MENTSHVCTYVHIIHARTSHSTYYILEHGLDGLRILAHLIIRTIPGARYYFPSADELMAQKTQQLTEDRIARMQQG